MQKERRKLNQAGMTLMELVVVVLIIGILSVGTGIGASYVNRMNATSAAEKLNSMLGRTKVLTISSKESVKLTVSLEGDTYYGTIHEGSTVQKKEKLGTAALTVKVDGVALVAGGSYIFSYNKSNGAFTSTYKKVTIEGSETKTIRLVTATGRSYLE